MQNAIEAGTMAVLRKAMSRHKILSAESERDLLRRYHNGNDKAAMDELVQSHLPLIFNLAKRNARKSGVDMNDLVQTATEGLLIAINRWSFEKSAAAGLRIRHEATQVAGEPQQTTASKDNEPEVLQPNEMLEMPHPSRLATYAMWWMRILLANTVIEQRGVVVRAKHPKVRRALFSLPKAIKVLNLQLPLSSFDTGRIAAYLGIGQKEIEEALTHAAGDVMLDEPVGENGMTRGETFSDERAEDEDGILSRLGSADHWADVCGAIMELDPRARFVLIARYLAEPKWNLDRLSNALRISRERIRQISLNNLAQIRRATCCPEPMADRRRPGRSKFVDVSLLPLLRGLGSVNSTFSETGGGRDDPRHSPEAKVAALILAFEQVSSSPDTDALPKFLSDQKILSGPIRNAQRSSTPDDGHPKGEDPCREASSGQKSLDKRFCPGAMAIGG